MSKRWRFFAMPFQWIRRGCFDWHAASVAWRLAINPQWFQPRAQEDARG